MITADLRNDAGGGKSEDRVFHSTVGKARWQNQNVILAPDVGIHNFLKLSQHGFGIWDTLLL